MKCINIYHYPNFLLKLIIFLFFIQSNALSKNDEETTKKTESKLSFKVGSYVYHMSQDSSDVYNESFNNKLFTVSYKISDKNEIVMGTLLNSYKDRCILLGVERNWYNFNSKLSFQGLYAYVGEFFVNQFSHCKDEGMYNIFKKHTGIGFAPYLYHGIKYDIFPFVSIEAGLILPGIVATTMRWQF